MDKYIYVLSLKIKKIVDFRSGTYNIKWGGTLFVVTNDYYFIFYKYNLGIFRKK